MQGEDAGSPDPIGAFLSRGAGPSRTPSLSRRLGLSHTFYDLDIYATWQAHPWNQKILSAYLKVPSYKSSPHLETLREKWKKK